MGEVDLVFDERSWDSSPFHSHRNTIQFSIPIRVDIQRNGFNDLNNCTFGDCSELVRRMLIDGLDQGLSGDSPSDDKIG